MKKVKLLFFLVLLLVLTLETLPKRSLSQDALILGQCLEGIHPRLYEPFMGKYRINYFVSNTDF